jgi:hypothetical protein
MLHDNKAATATVGQVTGVDYYCDGTADEVQINAAITAVNALGGGTVLIKEGTYDIAATIDLLSNVSLFGEGWGTILKATTNLNDEILLADNKNGILIADLAVDGNTANNASTVCVQIGTTVNASYNVFVQRCHLYDAGSDAFRIRKSYRVWATDNYVTGAGAAGIALGNISYQCFVHRNLVSSCTTTGIYSNGSSGSENYQLSIQDNFSVTNTQHGILLDYTDDSLIVGNLCQGNDSGNAATYDGIKLTNSDNNLIDDNRCTENDNYELNVASGSGNTVGGGNLLEGTDHENCFNDGATNTRTPTVDVPYIHDSTDANASVSNLGDHLTISCTDNQDVPVRFNFTAPRNLQQVVTANIRVASPCTGGTTLRWSCTTDFAGPGEVYNVESDSIAINSTTLAINTIKAIDLAAAFTGLDANDSVGVVFQRDGTDVADDLGAVLHILSFQLRYV